MSQNKNIVLVGFMGSGKTTVGKVLSHVLGYDFIDTDHIVVQNEKADIPSIFDIKGEKYFRKVETTALKQGMAGQDCVVSTGGGIVTTPENTEILRRGIVIYLEATPRQIYDHIKNDHTRPLLKEKDVYGTICTMLERRQELYKQVAHYSVNVDDKTPEEICALILDYIK